MHDPQAEAYYVTPPEAPEALRHAAYDARSPVSEITSKEVSRMSRFKALAGAALIVAVVLAFTPLGEAAKKAAEQALPKNSVGTEQLKANAVTRGKIKKANVTGDKLANGAVTATQLAGNAVTSGKIASAAVTSGKIAAGAVSSAALADKSVTTAKLAPVPGAGVRSSVAISVPPATNVAIPFTTVWFNNGGFSSNTPTRLKAPVSGIYMVNANIAWGAAISGTVRLNITLNGGVAVASDFRETTSGKQAVQSVSQVGPLNAGDYLELVVSQESGTTGSVVPYGQFSPDFQLVYIGPAS
jgi:hypothetical protein